MRVVVVMSRDQVGKTSCRTRPPAEELAEAGAEAFGPCTEKLHPAPQDAIEELFEAPPAATPDTEAPPPRGPEEQRPSALQAREAEAAVMLEAVGPTAQQLELQRQSATETEANRAVSEGVQRGHPARAAPGISWSCTTR